MRSESEIQGLIDDLERFNAAVNIADEENQCAFNSNSTMLCALRWVMGEDTIKLSKGEKQG